MAIRQAQLAFEWRYALRHAQAHACTVVGRKGVALDAVDIVEAACGRDEVARRRSLYAVASAKGPAKLHIGRHPFARDLHHEAVALLQGADRELHHAPLPEFILDLVARSILLYGALVEPTALLAAHHAQAERSGPLG